MTLPLTRNRTRTAADPVVSADMNDVDDMIVGARHGSIVVPFSTMSGHVSSGTLNDDTNGWRSDGAVDWVDVGIDLPVGTVITQVSAYVSQNAATAITWELQSMDNTDVVTNLITHAGNATTGSKVLTNTGVATIETGKTYRLRFKSNSSINDLFRFFELSIQK